MQYGEYAFSKDPKTLKTMEAKSGNKPLGQVSHMDAKDVMKINKLYDCEPSKKCKVCFMCLIISRGGPSLASTDHNTSALNSSAVSLVLTIQALFQESPPAHCSATESSTYGNDISVRGRFD